ncbi:MAG: beta-ketoacyl-[acyl-carrier-protein] synthase family protein [Gemmatimonadaceae bacterium]|nr:beta-ketoacyl-[acyl-carrier-protein] synthase family protein [Gemmatimonadaceae bacterium]MDQ3520317.1 beta-ketoacyl-[acyl-carrier-protein] synthase family protein [Gemmatimonadota bacterium]
MDEVETTVRTRVVITGVGPVSAIGSGRNEFWSALTNGQHGFGAVTLCDASLSPSKIAAEVKDFRLDDYITHGDVMARRTPRAVQLALAASVLALHDAEIDLDACDPERLGVFVGTSIGNLDVIMSLKERHSASAPVPPHAAFHCFNHSAACVLSSFFNIRGPVHTTTSGCNSGIDAVGQSARLIQAGAVDAMLVVGNDCELVPEVFLALNASGSLATRYNDDPGKASRPFDRARNGNVIGEGAAALLLESEEHAIRRGARTYSRLAGYHVASAGQNRQYSHDSPELDTRPSVRAMRSAITEAGWSADEVDLVNANGSSSVLYDRLEGMALTALFDEALPHVRIHSQKSMLGQHGGGSSALQAVAACLTIRRGIVPPTINCDDPDPACGDLRIVTSAEMFAPARVLVHAIGLGGFYYSAAAFEGQAETGRQTGMLRVRWSDGHNPKFPPAEDFTRPLVPWGPRQDT